MLKINPSQRVSCQDIIDNYLVDYNKTLVRRNSDPNLLQTIKVPRDMLKLKALLPEKRYKNAKQAEKLPDFKRNPSSVINDDKSVRSSVNILNLQSNKSKEIHSKQSSRPTTAKTRDGNVSTRDDTDKKILNDLITKREIEERKLKEKQIELENQKKRAMLQELQRDQREKEI